MPRRLISGETLADFEIRTLPEAVCSYDGPLIETSSSSSISFTLTTECRMPICTSRFPDLSGSDRTMPFRFSDRTFTESPTWSFLASTALCGVFSFSFLREASISSIFPRRAVRLRSISRAEMALPLILLNARMVSSAYCFVSRSKSAACCLAFSRILSFDSASFFSCSSSERLSRRISAWSFVIALSAFSMDTRRLSRSEITLSKLSCSSAIRPFASSMISSGSPRRFDMAKALLFPGTPISNR